MANNFRKIMSRLQNLKKLNLKINISHAVCDDSYNVRSASSNDLVVLDKL